MSRERPQSCVEGRGGCVDPIIGRALCSSYLFCPPLPTIAGPASHPPASELTVLLCKHIPSLWLVSFQAAYFPVGKHASRQLACKLAVLCVSICLCSTAVWSHLGVCLCLHRMCVAHRSGGTHEGFCSSFIAKNERAIHPITDNALFPVR